MSSTNDAEMEGAGFKKSADSVEGKKPAPSPAPQRAPLLKSLPTTPYILVLLDPASKEMPVGTERSIEAPYISLGRDRDCTICYGDEYPMVSRMHAAIEWSDDGYSLRHLSNTNQTLLNGKPIGRKWFLHDDDVIQLAPTGPKLKFKMPLILNMKPSKANAGKKGAEILEKNSMENIAMLAVIVLAVLLTILMVYLTISD